MNSSIIVGLLQNTAILLSFTMVYEYMWIRRKESSNIFIHIFAGIILGFIGIILMFTPWNWAPGIVFDTRSVMLSVAGLFFGPTPTVVAIIITGVARLIIGGEGQWMGLAVILSSGLIGVLWPYIRPEWYSKKSYIELFFMGLVVHLVMLGCTFFLPDEKVLSTSKTIILPLLLIYTPATMLLGSLMLKQANNWHNRMAQAKLRESERRLSQILEGGNILSIIIDKNGNISFCNNYLLQISNYSLSEVLGKNWFDLFIPEADRNQLKQFFSERLEGTNKVRNFENRILTKDGNILYISWYNISLRTDKNDYTGLASIGVNITESRLLEQNLKEKNNEIEKQNEEYKKLNEELLFAKEQAEESNMLKTAFLQNLSHEIRTPMNAIIGFADILVENELTTDKKNSFINIIHESSEQLLSIVNDILTISALETKQEKLNNNTVCINTLITEVYEVYKKNAEQKNIGFILHKPLSNDVSNITTDETKLLQIIHKLVQNAFKFTQKGKIEIGYDFHQNTIRFFVKDTGIGIDKKYHAVIFDRFRQVNQSTGRLFGGTGLGLAIAKELTLLLGGKIWVESEPDKGSAFYFTLPYTLKQSIIAQPVTIPVFKKDIYVLVAEDEEYNFLYLKELLKKLNIHVIHAENGAIAVEIIKTRNDISMVLMDINMPVMDGNTATKLIKQLNPDLPVIAQTAYGMQKDLYAGIFDDFLTKPIKKADFNAKIIKFVGYLNN